LKKIVSIAILFLFIYNTIGFLLVHTLLSPYYKYLGRQEAESTSQKEIIELLVLDKKDVNAGRIDFVWIDSGEFMYENEIYDLVKKSENNEQIFLFCINDKRELELEKEFQQRLNENCSNKKQKPENNNSLKSLTTEPNCYLISDAMNFQNLKYVSYNRGIILFLMGEVPTPPPKVFLSV
jgi:hypothetical protein